MGISNYEDSYLSGEAAFIKSFFSFKGNSRVVILDVGANNGEYSKIVRSFSKNAKIYAFEPHPVTFQNLKKTAGIFGFTAFCLGCSDNNGKGVLYDYADNNGSSHATLSKEVFKGLHRAILKENEISVVKLDDFVPSELKIEKIDLLKIDVEGNEFNVLKGARGLLRKNFIDIIQFEFNEMNIISRVYFKDFYELLSNYVFYRLLPDGLVNIGEYKPAFYEIFAYQNIVAVRKDLNLKF